MFCGTCWTTYDSRQILRIRFCVALRFWLHTRSVLILLLCSPVRCSNGTQMIFLAGTNQYWAGYGWFISNMFSHVWGVRVHYGCSSKLLTPILYGRNQGFEMTKKAVTQPGHIDQWPKSRLLPAKLGRNAGSWYHRKCRARYPPNAETKGLQPTYFAIPRDQLLVMAPKGSAIKVTTTSAVNKFYGSLWTSVWMFFSILFWQWFPDPA